MQLASKSLVWLASWVGSFGHFVGSILRSRGEAISDEFLAHVAPLGWEHIAFDGVYVWPAGTLGNAFRPLRTPRPGFL